MRQRAREGMIFQTDKNQNRGIIWIRSCQGLAPEFALSTGMCDRISYLNSANFSMYKTHKFQAASQVLLLICRVGVHFYKMLSAC